MLFSGDHVLLIRRNDVPVWTLPGGHRDRGESAAESCVREVFEETGLRVEIVRALGSYRRPWWLSGGRAAVFQCAASSGELHAGDYEADAAFWPVEALPSPTLYWYPPLIAAARDAGPALDGGPPGSPTPPLGIRPPTLPGFLASLASTPRLWLPLARHALDLYVASRLHQKRARR